jgi:hypothetical protein
MEIFLFWHPDGKGKIFTMKHPLKITAVLVLFFAVAGACGNHHTSKTGAGKHPDTPAVHYPNSLKGSKWIIADYRIIGYDARDTATFELFPFDSTVNTFNFAAVRFKDSAHYESYNSWECGNDCFITVNGTYAFTQSNEVSFYVDSIQRTGECAAPTIYPREKTPIKYILQKTGKAMQLVRK